MQVWEIQFGYGSISLSFFDNRYDEASSRSIIHETIRDNKQYLTCCRAFNAVAIGLMTVGSRVAQDPMIIKLAAAALNALQHAKYCLLSETWMR